LIIIQIGEQIPSFERGPSERKSSFKIYEQLETSGWARGERGLLSTVIRRRERKGTRGGPAQKTGHR